MTQKIFKDNSDKYVIIPRLVSVTNATGEQNPIFGSANGESLYSIYPYISAYWYECSSNEEIDVSHSITWSANLGMWKSKIPSVSINRGSAWISISGQNEDGSESIIPAVVEVYVDTYKRMDVIVPPDLYDFLPDNNQIVLKGDFSDVGVEQIKSIYNLTHGNELYSSKNPRKRNALRNIGDIDIDLTDGIITYVDDAHMNKGDKLQIIVNKA